jgi:hypothetical protein
MKPKDFARLVERDQRCLHCGETEAISPNHRINRGMGGSKLRDQPSNLVVICSILNGLIESDNRWASVANQLGWKLQSWQKPQDEPVFDTLSGNWFLLDDDFNRKVIEHQGREE